MTLPKKKENIAIAEKSVDNVFFADLATDKSFLYNILHSIPNAVVVIKSDLRVKFANYQALTYGVVEAVTSDSRQGCALSDKISEYVSHIFSEQSCALAQGELLRHHKMVLGDLSLGLSISKLDYSRTNTLEQLYLLVVEDTTEYDRVETVRRDFVANVSHELKTPITLIKGAAETLIDGALRDPLTADKFIGIVARHADRLYEIVEDLLKLSRIQLKSERGITNAKDCSISGLFDSVIEQCTPFALTRHCRIVSSIYTLDGSRDIHLILHARLFQHAIMNLVDNAIKASHENDIVYIEAIELDNGSKVKFIVRDRGIGIEEKHLSRIFERFYRVDLGRGRDSGGSGIGLSLVKHIVQAHGGTINVKSEVNLGSEFVIVVPGKKRKSI